MTPSPMVVDLSHWDPAYDYAAVKEAGIVGVIYKATEATDYCDPTYVDQQQAAKAVGLRWGSYHFAHGSNVNAQVDNYLRFACPDPDEIFCLDWEDCDDIMSVDQAKQWISAVEHELGRPEECLIYSGNTAKDLLGDTVDSFLGSRRLWLAQYSTNPVPQRSWASYWLWQYTDGVVGPVPHSIDGIGPCDINHYDGDPEELYAEWAYDLPPPIRAQAVTVIIAAPPGVPVHVRRMPLPNRRRRR